MQEFLDRCITFSESNVTFDVSDAVTSVFLGKSLLVVKDSFANSFLPFLVRDYDTITVLDLRFYREGVQPLADQADDVLVLYELTNFASDKNLYKLNKT